MAISVPPRGIQASLANRQARPMTGKEITLAIENHLLTLSARLLDKSGLLSDQVILLTDDLREKFYSVTAQQSRLQKINLTYPKVGWNIKVHLEELEEGSFQLSGQIELDLERNLRLNLHIGQTGLGRVVGSLEDEKIQNSIPDADRKAFGLPVQAEYLRPDGTVGRVDLNELKGEKRAARTVDVGSAKIIGQEVSMGEEIKLPSELPEVTFDDDLVASPPEIPKEPPSEPLPPKHSMSNLKRPDVKFKKK